MAGAKTYEGWSSAVFIAGIYEGLMPFVATLFGWHPFWSLPMRLPVAPRLIVAAAVIIAAVAALEALDRAKLRAAGGDADRADAGRGEPTRGGGLTGEGLPDGGPPQR